MSVFINFLFVFFILWWLVLFCVLPFSLEKSEKGPEGSEKGAPDDPKLKRKFIITSLITLVITVAYVYLTEIGVIDFVGYIERLESDRAKNY